MCKGSLDLAVACSSSLSFCGAGILVGCMSAWLSFSGVGRTYPKSPVHSELRYR